MADTAVVITAGTGTNIDTRTEGTNGNHRQVVVVGDPATNAGVAPVDATAGLKVDLGADNDVTVTGTVDLGATDNAVLDSILADTTTIAGDTTSIDAKTPALGQALAAASVPVVLTASQLTTLTPPAAISGFATAAKQDTIIGHVDGVETLLGTIDADTSALAGAVAGTEMQVDVVSSALPTGASTAAKQPALGTAGTASSDVITVQGIASMTALKVDNSAVTQPISHAALTELAAAINTDKLDVNIKSSDVATGGTSAADDADFTATTTSGTPAMGVYESTPTSVTDGDLGVAGITSTRALKVQAQANSGVDIGDVTVNNATIAVTQSGTWDEVGINDSGNSITIDGTVTADLGATDNAVLDAIAASTLAIETAVEGTLTVTGGGGGVEYTEGDIDATIVGSAIMWEDTSDTLRAVSAAKPLPISDAGGALTVDGTVAATQSGTWNVTNVSGTVSLPTGASTAANQSTIIGHVDGIETVLGTIDTDTGNIATSVALIDDAITTLGTDTYTEATSKGITIGAVRRDADTTLANTTNEFTPLQVDAAGRLKVEAFSGETLPVSFTGSGDVATQTTLAAINTKLVTGTDIGDVTINNSTGAAAVNIQDGGNTITVDGTVTANLSVADNAVLDSIEGNTSNINVGLNSVSYVDDADWTADTSKHSLVGAVTQVATTANTDGDTTPLTTNAHRELRTAIPESDLPTAGTAHTKKYYTNAGAVTDGIVWSPAAGKRWFVTDLIVNVSAAATVTFEDDKAGGDEAVMKFELAANSGLSHSFTTPWFSGEDAADLIVTSSAGNIYITCVGYEI